MAIVTSKWNAETKTSEEVVLGEGTTVAWESQYLGDGDSSFWGVYFDYETGEFKVGGGGYTPAGITVDAPEDVREAYNAKKEAEAAASRAKVKAFRARQNWLDAKYEAATPRPGKTLKVVAGRKVPKGTVGECFWYGETQYGYRVGMLVEGEKVWTAASNVEVVEAALATA